MRGRSAFWVVAATGFFGCSGDDGHPPEYQQTVDASTVANPRSCSEIQAGEPADGNVIVGGEVAACASVGMACPLGNSQNFAAACDAGTPIAICGHALRWVLACELDAGLGDAGGDAPNDADATADAAID